MHPTAAVCKCMHRIQYPRSCADEQASIESFPVLALSNAVPLAAQKTDCIACLLGHLTFEVHSLQIVLLCHVMEVGRSEDYSSP